MIQITSYLRMADGTFISIDDASVVPADPDYVEGAIELTIDGKVIIDTPLWDYVDQLWSYIGDMIVGLEERGEASTYFPDQPIRLSFRKQGAGRVLVTLAFNDERRVASAAEGELVAALSEHGSAFFRKMTALLPENGAGYADALDRLNRRIARDLEWRQ